MEEKLRILGITTSPRKGGNTTKLVERALQGSEEFALRNDYRVEKLLVSLAAKRIEPCRNCGRCVREGSYCVIGDDWWQVVQSLLEPMPDGLIFGSPVYFFSQNALARCFMERCTCLIKKIWCPDFPNEPPDFSRVAAGAVGVGGDRNGGVEHALSAIINWLLMMGFTVVGGSYIGGAGWAKRYEETDAIWDDSAGLESATKLGKAVARTGILLKEGSKVAGFESKPNVLL